jgi:hypothetical protein
MHMHQNNLFLIQKIVLNNPKHNLVDPKKTTILQSLSSIFPSFLTSVSSIDKRGIRVCKVPLIARINSCTEQFVASFHHANTDG